MSVIAHASSPVRRCAVYTRKSSEEGLEQDFNSLHAQREACEAFIRSQAGEGWRLLKAHYDDGGISGGTMERPALQRLLNDIKNALVDVVVVYKVDRLTRSLADFAKMVEIFDAHSASFVAVTQQFNTTTSMGRLTLNVLLSFAQFEREVTGERIRDKIAASKAKGIWMGGTTPLGYDVHERKLVINQPEAETVKLIYRRYLELRSVRLLQQDLDRRGTTSKTRVSKSGADQVGDHSRAERSMNCCRTRSTSGRSGTRSCATPASTKPSWIENCGKPYRSTYEILRFEDRSRGPRQLQVSWRGSCSMRTGSRSTRVAPQREGAATDIMCPASSSGLVQQRRGPDGAWPGRRLSGASPRR